MASPDPIRRRCSSSAGGGKIGKKDILESRMNVLLHAAVARVFR